VMYVVRPLDRPRGWFVGASYRSDGISKLFASARLGDNGLVGLADLKRGALQAVVGQIARFANMDLGNSALIELMRKSDAGVWDGTSPMDRIPRLVAYQRVQGREMSVVAGIATDTAMQPLAKLAAASWELAALASIVVLAIAAILVWAIATSQATRQRKRTLERTEQKLMNVRRDLELAQARTRLTEPEAGVLLSSDSDGVARLDAGQCLRTWNRRFGELAGVEQAESMVGLPAEALFRRQADAGVFGDAADPEQAVALRLTVLHASGESVAPPVQFGPNGERIALLVRSVTDGGNLMILIAPEHQRLSELSPPAVADAAETADETIEM
jgi:PAS domain-containing protein